MSGSACGVIVCITRDGHIIDPYYVLEYLDWVIVVALTPDAEIVHQPFLGFVRDSRMGKVDVQGLNLAALYLVVPYILQNELPGLAELRQGLRADLVGGAPEAR